MAIGDITGAIAARAYSSNASNYARGVSVVHARDNIYVGTSKINGPPSYDAEAASVAIDSSGNISPAIHSYTFTRGMSYSSAFPVASAKIADGVILIAWEANPWGATTVQLDTLAVSNTGVISAIDNATVTGDDDVLQICHIANDVYAFLTADRYDVILHTISVNAAGNITLLNSYGIPGDVATICHARDDIYAIAVQSSLYYTTIYTIEITDDGTIGASTLGHVEFTDTDARANSDPDMFKISEGVVGFVATGRTTRVPNIVTFSVPADGLIDDSNLIDTYIDVLKIDDGFVYPYMQQISTKDNLYAFTMGQDGDPTFVWVVTVEIDSAGNITDPFLDATSGNPKFTPIWGGNYTPFIHLNNGLCCSAHRADGGQAAYFNTFQIELSSPPPPISGSFVFAAPETTELEPNFTPFDPKLKHSCDHYLASGQHRLANCPRCLGTGYYFDIKFNDVGRVTQVDLSNKLAQTFEKFVVTEQNIFHPEVAINVPQWLGNVTLTEVKAAIKFDLIKALTALQEAQRGAPNLTDRTQIARVNGINVYDDPADPTRVYYTVAIITAAGQQRTIDGTIILNR